MLHSDTEHFYKIKATVQNGDQVECVLPANDSKSCYSSKVAELLEQQYEHKYQIHKANNRGMKDREQVRTT